MLSFSTFALSAALLSTTVRTLYRRLVRLGAAENGPYTKNRRTAALPTGRYFHFSGDKYCGGSPMQSRPRHSVGQARGPLGLLALQPGELQRLAGGDALRLRLQGVRSPGHSLRSEGATGSWQWQSHVEQMAQLRLVWDLSQQFWVGYSFSEVSNMLPKHTKPLSTIQTLDPSPRMMRSALIEARPPEPPAECIRAMAQRLCPQRRGGPKGLRLRQQDGPAVAIVAGVWQEGRDSLGLV